MHVAVHSLKKTLFDGEAVSLNCKTTSGEVTILDHHRPLVTVLQKGTVVIIDKNQKEYFIPIDSGFLETTSENKTKLIVN
ncbi:MAG: hypothetical protein AAB903_02775 [Patescibacteria group bacterium]|mgnify:CR=1 FL=1